MRIAFVLLLALAAAMPALAGGREPYVRTCATSQLGDLGRGWQERAVVAGHVAFVGLRNGYERWRPRGPGAWPLKVIVVADPNSAPTVTIAERSRGHASLGYNEVRYPGGASVSLSRGVESVRFEACRPSTAREPWNRGTQFGGVFLVSGRRCVHVEVATQGKVLRRVLRFGRPRCASLPAPDP